MICVLMVLNSDQDVIFIFWAVWTWWQTAGCLKYTTSSLWFICFHVTLAQVLLVTCLKEQMPTTPSMWLHDGTARRSCCWGESVFVCVGDCGVRNKNREKQTLFCRFLQIILGFSFIISLTQSTRRMEIFYEIVPNQSLFPRYHHSIKVTKKKRQHDHCFCQILQTMRD